MQAIRNKLHGKSKRNSLSDKKTEERSIASQDNLLADNPITSNTSDGLHDSYSKTTTTVIETTSFDSTPTPPPMPPVDFWKTGSSINYWNEELFFPEYRTRSSSFATDLPYESTRTLEMLPTEFIEKPAIIHENVRREQVEEIQPLVRVEHEKTEIRQITQPLTDKEIKPVIIEERTLPLEVLPTVTRDVVAMPEKTEISTRTFDSTMRQVVEKSPIVEETERWRIIEEIQPIIYRETIIPHVIRTSRPIREVIVEAPVFTERTLEHRVLTMAERERYSQFFSKEFVSRDFLPVELPAVIPVRSVPVSTLPEATRHKKEIIEETTTTTTTTTVAPTVGSTLASSTRSGSSVSTMPVVLDESHTARFGPKGETITRDTITTSSQTLLPTRAN